MRSSTSLTFTLLALASCLVDGTDEQLSSVGQGARVRGAIFTTLVDGTAVNHNIYNAKEDVYLDGGPSGGSPSSAAALAAGNYYFQVTDPSGKTLLSEDDISCREIAISDDGVITAVSRGSDGCQHRTGTDQDYAPIGAITVQLMPYANTPNPGGVYKVWVTPVDAYVGGGYSPGSVHGFLPAFSKMDVFKVRVTLAPPPPCCGDGTVDDGEECDDGNTVDGDGCSSTCTKEPPPPPPPCCGDGKLDEGEQCDDGNNVDGDGCSSTCTKEPPPPEPCCGDGKLDSGEQCDDGNTVDGDGCSSTCTKEPPPPEPCCGDGKLDSGEDCDDGNTKDGDGCSSTCEAEFVAPPVPDGILCTLCVTTVQTSTDAPFLY